MKWISVFAFLLIALSLPVQATSIEVAFLGYSNHYVDRDYDYNEQHKLIGFSINNGFSVANFTNSYNRKSTLVGWKFQTDDALMLSKLSFDARVVLGLVTGYKQEEIITYINEDISLYLIPELIISYPITDTISLSLVNGIVPDSKGIILMHHLELSFDDLF
ncbi:hypothetical protein VFES401_18510 [Aliivibrio fischeri]|uniref:hypothetical protein n=1 Tax=Aliivibrio fischeri TaxID=668 RepID=UPI00107EDC38|nr:hypothetical protein [Aliivibrio fischeri]TGA68855.1 hypothetical protein VFES401_18510 [Aliivibrio fischeri]